MPFEVTNLTVYDGQGWQIMDNLQTGIDMYTDRSYLFGSVPADYLGCSWIRTANDSKGSTDNPIASFDISVDSNVYAAVDNRVSPPSWISDWSDTGDDLFNDNHSDGYSIYSKTFSAGTVSLGSHNNGDSMYTVIVRPLEQ